MKKYVILLFTIAANTLIGDETYKGAIPTEGSFLPVHLLPPELKPEQPEVLTRPYVSVNLSSLYNGYGDICIGLRREKGNAGVDFGINPAKGRNFGHLFAYGSYLRALCEYRGMVFYAGVGARGGYFHIENDYDREIARDQGFLLDGMLTLGNKFGTSSGSDFFVEASLLWPEWQLYKLKTFGYGTYSGTFFTAKNVQLRLACGLFF